MTAFWADLRYALRQLRKSPGFTVTAVVTLALGIGATTAIFSIVDGVLLRPLPFRDPGRLVALGDNIQGIPNPAGMQPQVTARETVTYARDTHAFSSMGGCTSVGYELSGAGEPTEIVGSRLSAGVFPTLGVAPWLGRVFTQQEDVGSQPVTVLSYALWRDRFHADPHVLGKKILLDRKPYIVIGVMPRNFEFPLVPGHLNRSELWVPMSLTPDELGSAGQTGWNFQLVARLKPGVSLAQAQADANRVATEIMRSYPSDLSSVHIDAEVQPLRDSTVAQARPLVRILFLAVIVVLLIACANLAGLLLVRAIRRRRETAVRLTLGAGARTLVRQAMLESVVLSVSGGLIGIMIAWAALQVSVSLLPETLPRIADIHLNWVVIGFALFLAIVTGVLSAVAPAFAALHTNMNDVLKEGGRTGSVGSGHANFRSVLVIAEIAVALVLLIASGLLLRSFQKMRDVNLGFFPRHTVVATYSLPNEKYSTQVAVTEFNQELLRRLRQLPGTESVGLVSSLPMSGTGNNSVFVPEGYVSPKGENLHPVWVFQTEGNYFHSMGIPLLRGRFFTDDDKAGTPLVAIVNRKLAEHYWPGQNPIGKRIRAGVVQTPTPWMTVVGEIANVKLTSPDATSQVQYYQPGQQAKATFGRFVSPTDLVDNEMSIALQTALPPEQMENALRTTVRSLDPQLALTQIQSMTRAVSGSEAPRRFNTSIITAFAILAVLLAILGVYSVIAFSVALRTQEMGIRLALGSTRSGILLLVLRSGAQLALVGCVIGIAGSIIASRLLSSFLFQVKPFDPLVLILAAAVILALSLAASALPARRASSIDPMQTLKSE